MLSSLLRRHLRLPPLHPLPLRLRPPLYLRRLHLHPRRLLLRTEERVSATFLFLSSSVGLTTFWGAPVRLRLAVLNPGVRRGGRFAWGFGLLRSSPRCSTQGFRSRLPRPGRSLVIEGAYSVSCIHVWWDLRRCGLRGCCCLERHISQRNQATAGHTAGRYAAHRTYQFARCACEFVRAVAPADSGQFLLGRAVARVRHEGR